MDEETPAINMSLGMENIEEGYFVIYISSIKPSHDPELSRFNTQDFGIHLAPGSLVNRFRPMKRGRSNKSAAAAATARLEMHDLALT